MQSCPAGAAVKTAGLATHFIPSASLPDVETELRRQGAYMRDAAAVDRTLSAFEVRSRLRAHSAGNPTERDICAQNHITA